MLKVLESKGNKALRRIDENSLSCYTVRRDFGIRRRPNEDSSYRKVNGSISVLFRKFAYRISQMVNLAAEKTTEEHLTNAVSEFSKAIGCEIDDYCLYIDYDVSPARYVLLVEPDHVLPTEKPEEYARIFEEKFRYANKEYAGCRDDRSIGHPVVLLQQQQTHQLWREFKIYKGASPNQVKPVRILDAPQKEKFFFGMLEEGSGREILDRIIE